MGNGGYLWVPHGQQDSLYAKCYNNKQRIDYLYNLKQ